MQAVRVAICGAAVTLSLSACAGHSDPCGRAEGRGAALLACSMPAGSNPGGTPIPLSTSSWKPGDDKMMIAIRGRIALSEGDCVYLEGSDGSKSNVIWPAGYSAELRRDGTLTLRNPAGEAVGHEGTQVSVAGGGISMHEGGKAPDVACKVGGGVFLYVNDQLPPL